MSDDIREEQYLADIRTAAQGGEGYYDLPPIIRKEFYYTDIINALKNGGGGGGTSDYTQLTNKPEINGTTLTGNKSSSDLGLQDKIDSNNKLSSSNVSFTTAENAALTSGIDSTKVAQISTNETNILSLQQTIGDINSVLEEVL